jgi:hypothetical protein
MAKTVVWQIAFQVRAPIFDYAAALLISVIPISLRIAT